MYVKVPCDYKDSYYVGYHLDDGRYLICSDIQNGKLPEIINCPKCNSDGYIRIPLEEAREKIDELFEQRKELNEEIKALEKAIENALP